MKKLLLNIALAVTLTVGVPTFNTGCGNTSRGIYNTEVVVINSVDAAMLSWRDHVKAGKATQDQVDKVKASYAKYYESQQILKETMKAYVAEDVNDNTLTTALTVLNQNKASLLNLIVSFMN